MQTPNILTTEPKDILHKEAFKRTIPSGNMTEAGPLRHTGDYSAEADAIDDHLRFEILSQADFMREYDVNSHNINSMKYYTNPVSRDDNKYYRKVKTRVAIAFQERILTKRLSALTSNNTNLRITNVNSGERELDMLALFREGWEDKNIENALYEAILADGKTGDCALCFYLQESRVGWRSFSYDKGDILYPHYDPLTGRLALFGRRYTVIDEDGSQNQYLDVWDDKFYARYVMQAKRKGSRNAMQWVTDLPATPHKFPRIPICYDRYGAPFWANSQSLIEAYEMAISQLCENNMAYALRILYTFGADMSMKSTIDGTPTRIDSIEPNAKVGFLEPADASSSFTLQLTTLEKNIMRSSFAVETPEIKSGSDMSSLTVKMLFADAYQKAIEDSLHFQPFLDDVVALFKYGYGVETGRSSDFEVFKVKAEIIPYIFMSEQEQISNIVQLKGIGALSARTASEMAYEIGYGVVDEYGRIRQEEHDALVDEAALIENPEANVINTLRNG